MWRRSLWLVAACLFVFSACSPHTFFYLPNRKLYSDPANRGMPYDMVTFPSLNGKTLYGILFHADGEPQGTVVHLHGNFGNVSNHYTQSHFLTHYGFDVLVVDYQGYGASEGRATPKHTVEDGIAAVRFAQSRLAANAKGVVLFGQSLGAAVATVVAAKEPLVKAVVLESPFSRYRSIAREVTKRSWITWPLYPVYPLMLGSTYDPVRFVAQISPRPVLFVHGDQDEVVPLTMSEQLFQAAKEPKRIRIWKGARHLECKRVGGTEYEKELADFFSAALNSENQK